MSRSNPATGQLAPGTRVVIRDEEWLVRQSRRASTGGLRLDVTGLSELVRDRDASFLTDLDPPTVLAPEATALVPDPSPRYRDTRLYLDCLLRRQPPTDAHIHVGHRAACDRADYQLAPATQALSQLRPRILMADGVGLGKTIEVGILLSELIQRGRGDRILVVALKSILAQFQLELWARFTIPLVRLDSVGIQRIQAEIPSNQNPFQVFDKVIVSIDTLKNDAKYRQYLEDARWDVIVVDECQNVAPRADERSTLVSQRARLAQLLARQSDALILTSATPHDGRARSFAGLIHLLEPTAIKDDERYTADEVRPWFLRRFKKDVAAEAGEAFQERQLELVRTQATPPEDAAFELLKTASFQTIGRTRSGKQRAQSSGARGMLFRTLLLKAFLSSPRACLETVEQRLAHKDVQADTEAAAHDRNVLQALAATLRAIPEPDFAKYQTLLAWLRSEGFATRSSPERVVIFSERLATLRLLRDRLTEDLSLQPAALGIFHGQLDDQQQRELVQAFGTRDSALRILLCSDAAAEGLNLHYFCHRLLHFDLPWSLITLEQRNGRIDRFGQQHQPQLRYLLTLPSDPDLQGDLRILERLIEKEDQAWRNIGDVAWLMNLHDADREEERIAESVEGETAPEVAIPDQATPDDDLFDLLFGGGGGESSDAPVTVDSARLYANDLDYAQDAFEAALGPKSKDLVRWHDGKQGFTLRPPDDLLRRLRLLPTELREDAKDGLDLTTDRTLVMESLARARETTGAWPEWQLFWELNPIARWLDDRVLQRFGRHEAPIVGLAQGLAPGERVVVLQGLISNNRGQPIHVETVGIPFPGGSDQPATPEPFEDLVARTGLDRPLANPGNTSADPASLQRLLPAAVEAMRAHLEQRRNARAVEIGKALRPELRKLNDWKRARLAAIDQLLADPKLAAPMRKLHQSRRREIEAIHAERQAWVDEGLRTAPDLAIRVLAVLVTPG